MLRANYRPTRLLPIYPRERALLGYGGRAIDGTRACAREYFSVYRESRENNGMRACIRTYVYVYMCARRREGGIRRKTNGERGKKAHHPNARDWREAFLRSLPWRSRILAAIARTPYRFVARLLYSALLFFHFHYILYFGKLSEGFLQISPSCPRPTHARHLISVALSQRRGEEMLESLHTANREAEKGHLRAAKLDRKGRHKLLGRYSPTSFSLPCLSRCAASRPEICARRK